jgi:outer membrane biosynthesis protein TonB
VIDRGDISGFTVAAIGHAGLIALVLLLSPKGDAKALHPTNPPIEVTLTDEIALDATVTDPGEEDPAARLSPIEAPVEPDAAPAEPDKPEVAPQPIPKPAPAANARDRSRPDRPSAAPNTSRSQPSQTPKPSGALDGLNLTAPGSKANNSTSERQPPAPIGAAVRSSLAAEVLRQIKPYWVPPSGADSEKLRTSVRVSLDRSGNITQLGNCTQSGMTASNQPQLALACENAKRAIRRAAPFRLPDQFYDAWKTIEPTLYEDL